MANAFSGTVRDDLQLMVETLNSLRGDLRPLVEALNSLREELRPESETPTSLRGRVRTVYRHPTSIRGELRTVYRYPTSIRGGLRTVYRHLINLRGGLRPLDGTFNCLKSLSGWLPQDDPDVRITDAQTDLKSLAEKENGVYARLGRQVYESRGGENCPGAKAELDLLECYRIEIENRLQEAIAEKEARGRTVNAETPAAARFCPSDKTEIND